MTNPIIPPPELVEQWEAETAHTTKDEMWHMAVQAAQWGADQELNECCEFLLLRYNGRAAVELVNKRRPKPPSLKEQALTQLTQLVADFDRVGMKQQASTLEGPIRRAVEALPND